MISANSIIVKPSVGGESGRGVELYSRLDSGEFALHNNPDIVLDTNRLNNLGPNFIIQETLQQSSEISTFNPTSVNTLRIATYRSVKDNEVHILSSVIRIGNAGSVVDNLHSGGKMVRINENGTLANYCSDQYGRRTNRHNGIDFSIENHIIPNYDKVKAFAREVSSKILHARLVQLDIMLDQNNQPKLIEFNINGFSMWIAQFTGTPALGRFTDEIRDYTISKLNK